LTLLGQHKAALEFLNEERSLADRFASVNIRATLRMKMAEVYLEMGDFEQAGTALEEARELAGKFERASDMAWLLIDSAEIARREWEAGRLQQIGRAAAQIEQAIALLRGTHWTYELGSALQTAAWIALARNLPEQALVYSEEAVELFELQPVRPEGYQYVHACTLWANGRDEEASQYLDQAYQRIMQVARQTQNTELRRSWLEDIPLHRQIIQDAELS